MNRTHEDRAIAVVRTRLPYIDRRALSQAWFSALHLASGADASPAARRPAQAQPMTAMGVAPASAAATPALPQVSDQTHLPDALKWTRTAGAAARAGDPGRADPLVRFRQPAQVAESRPRARTTAAVEGEPSGSRRVSKPAFRTSLTCGVAGERVQLVVRRDGATLRVVAVCRPAVEGVVRRALALAASHLRQSGDVLRTDVLRADVLRADERNAGFRA